MTLFVAPIVEGETEELCIKIVLSRVWRELLGGDAREPLAVLPPEPAKRSSLVKDGHPELGEKIERAYRRVRACLGHAPEDRGFILMLLDADDDCPKALAPKLLQRAVAARSDADVACVVAKRELENWFKAAAKSLAGVGGLPADLEIPSNPEEGNGDSWLTRQMQKTNRRLSYVKPSDAIEFARKMDVRQCHDYSPSFAKLCRELRRRQLPPDEDPPAAP